jgi:hypothetical protein
MAVTPSPTPQYMILTTIWLYLILKQWLLLLTNNQLQHVVVNMTMHTVLTMTLTIMNKDLGNKGNILKAMDKFVHTR